MEKTVCDTFGVELVVGAKILKAEATSGGVKYKTGTVASINRETNCITVVWSHQEKASNRAGWIKSINVVSM